MFALHLLIVWTATSSLVSDAATDSSTMSLALADQPSSLFRNRNGGPPLPITPSQCNFGRGRELVSCGWSDTASSSLTWQLSSGRGAYFRGGPTADASKDNDGGYILVETSQGSSQAAALSSFIRNGTQPDGRCVVFQYAMSSPNAEQLRLVLRPIGLQLNGSEAADTLWQAGDAVQQEWQTAAILYSFAQPHQLIFEATAGDSRAIHRRKQGYIVLDNVDLGPEGWAESPTRNLCSGHCNFDGGLCAWTNDQQDDFNWKLGRGSLNGATGPSKDHSTFASSSPSRGYVFIDSGYPRRPGDKAKLLSPQMPPTDGDQPLCLRFWTHMFGNGIGTLRVILRSADQERQLWALSAEAGNTWHQGQLTVSSATPFQIVFEAIVGRNNLGDIALDDIVIHRGSCPSSPQTAAAQQGDCNFELDECGWSHAGAALALDDIDWSRISAENHRHQPFNDHTTSTPKGYVMSPSRSSVQRPGDRAWLISRLFNVSDAASIDNRCLTFWYFMNEPIIDPAGPGLGSLRVYVRQEDAEDAKDRKPVPIWRLRNHQADMWMMAQASIHATARYRVIIEGLWGSSRSVGSISIDDVSFYDGSCSTYPVQALPMPMECSFDRDFCQWSIVQNATGSSGNSGVGWRLASLSRRPANLPDHTFAAPRGYVYFDVFNQASNPEVVRMMGPTIDKKIAGGSPSLLCFTFWFSAFGAGETTQLRILIVDSNAQTEQEIWTLRVSQMKSVHSDWHFGQVQMAENGADESTVVFEGRASNGGFAIDDVTVYDGGCENRPQSTMPQAGQ